MVIYFLGNKMILNSHTSWLGYSYACYSDLLQMIWEYWQNAVISHNTANDTSYANLKILKGDGTLVSLTEAGITSINTNITTTNTTDSNGNIQTWSGMYTTTSGTTLTLGDYQLQANNAYSIATDWVETSETIEALPDIAGYGTVYSLHQAMARDTDGSLTALIQNFINTTNDTTRWTLINEILKEWTGTVSIELVNTNKLLLMVA